MKNETLENSGVITGTDTTTVNTTTKLINKGELSSSNSLLITAPLVDNSGTIMGVNAYEVNANELDLSGAFGGKTGKVDVDSLTVTKDGYISTETGEIIARIIANKGQIKGTDKLIIKSVELTNNGVITGDKSVKIIKKENSDSLTLNNTGRIQSGELVDLDSKTLTNKGIIVSGKKVTLKNETLENSGVISGTDTVAVNSTIELINTGELSSNNVLSINTPLIDNSGKIVGATTYDITADELNLSGLLGGGAGDIKLSDLTVTEEGKIITKLGKVVAKIIVTDGLIQANDTLDILTDNLKNSNDLLAYNNLNLTAKNIENSGSIQAVNELKVKENDKLINNNVILAGKLNSITSKEIENNGSLISNENIDINASKSIISSGNLNAGKNINVNTDDLTIAGKTETGNDLILSSNTAKLSGKIKTKNLNMSADNLNISKDNADDYVIADEKITVNTKESLTNSSTVNSKDIDIQSPKFTNNGEISSENSFSVKSNTIENNSKLISDNSLDINKLNDVVSILNNNGTIAGFNSLNIIGVDTVNNKTLGILYTKDILTMNKISLINNEGKINGVKTAVITTDNIKNKNLLSAGENLNLNTKLAVNDGKIIGDGNITVNSTTITNNNVIKGNKAELNADIVENSKYVLAKEVKITGKTLTNKTNAYLQGENSLAIKTTANIRNEGNISGSNLNLDSNTITNDGTLKTTDNLDLKAKNITSTKQISVGKTMNSDGNFTSSGNIYQYSKDGLVTFKNGTVTNSKNIAVQGSIDATGISSVTNSGKILSEKDIMVKNLNNENGVLQSDNNLIVTNIGTLNNKNGKIISTSTTGKLAVTSSNINNSNGEILANNEVNLNTTGDLVINGKLQGMDKTEITTKNLIVNTKLNSNNIDLNASTINLSNSNAEIKADDTVTLTLTSDFGTTDKVRGANKTSITAKNVTVNNKMTSNNIEINAKGSVTVNKEMLAAKDVTVDAKEDIINNSKIQSENKIKLVAKNDLTNNGMIASNNHMELIGKNITNNSDKVMFATKQLDLKSNGKILNKGTLLSSSGDVNITGETKIRATEFENYVAAVEAGRNIVIKSDTVKNIGVVEGTPTEKRTGRSNYTKEEVFKELKKKRYSRNVREREVVTQKDFDNNENVPYWDNIYYDLYKRNFIKRDIEKINLDNSNYYVNQASIKSNNNVYVEGENLNNYGSLISAKNDININISGTVNNQTPVYKRVNGNFKKVLVVDKYECQYDNGHGRDGTDMCEDYIYVYRHQNIKGTLTTETRNKAQILAGKNLKITGNKVGNGIRKQGTSVAVENLNRVKVTTVGLEDIKKTGTISVNDNITLPTDEFGLFKVNENFKDQNINKASKIEIVKSDKINIKNRTENIAISKETITQSNKTINKQSIELENKVKEINSSKQELTTIDKSITKSSETVIDNGTKIDIKNETVKSKDLTVKTVKVESKDVDLTMNSEGVKESSKDNDLFTHNSIESKYKESKDRDLSTKEIKVEESNVKDITKQDITIKEHKSEDITVIKRKEPNYTYLVETNVEFIDTSKYYGSEYFFKRIGYNLEKDVNINLLGDSYYETQLVSKTLAEATGKQYLSNDVHSDTDQMKELYDNASVAMKDLNLTVGVEMTKEQINALNKDIIWMVEKEVKGHKVLVPQVYLCKATLQNLTVEGSTIKAGKDLTIIANNVDNTGSLIGSKTVNIKADNITNVTVSDVQAEIKGGNVNLVAEKDIINKGANITGEDSVDIFAGENLVFDTVKNTTKEQYGDSIKTTTTNISSNISGKNITLNAGKNITLTGTNVDAENDLIVSAKGNLLVNTAKDISYSKLDGNVNSSVTNASSTLKGTNLTLSSEKDITLKGVTVTATNNLALTAGSDLSVESVEDKTFSSGKDGNTEYEKRTITNQTSNLSGKNVIMNSNKNIILSGTKVKATDNILLSAKEDVVLKAVKDSTYSKTKTKSKKLFSSKETTTEKYDETVVGTNLTGGNISISAGNDIGVIGSKLNTTTEDSETGILGDITLNATNSVYAVEEKENDYSYSQTKRKGFKLSLSGGIFKAGIEKKTKTTFTMDNVGKASNILGDNVTINTGDKVVIKGSNISADAILSLSAKNGINILATKDKHIEKTVEETEFAGLTVSVNSDILNLKNNIEGLKSSIDGIIHGSKEDILNGLSSGITQTGSVASGINALPDYTGKGVNNNETNNMKLDYKKSFSTSIGIEKTKDTNKSVTETIKSSTLSGGIVNLTSESGDVKLEGSNVFGYDVNVKAKNLFVTSAQELSTTENRGSNQSVSIGIDGKSLMNVNGAMGEIKGNSKTVTNINSLLSAAGKMTITTIDDLKISGGNVKADTLDANVGGNLTVASVQDTYTSSNKSKNGSVSIGLINVASSSASYNFRNDKANKSWITNQSGITVNNGGKLKVGNNTQLKGAVISSSNKDKALTLDTKSLTTEDISDDDESESKGLGIGVGSSPSFSVVYGKKDKEQINRATISNIDLLLNGSKTDTDKLGINTNLSKSQEITKDKEIKTIDADLHVELASKEGRKEYKDSIRDAADKVKDVASATVNRGEGKGFTNTLKSNRFTTRGKRAVEADEKLQNTLNSLKNIEDKKERVKATQKVLQEVMDTYYEANGFDKQNAPLVTIADDLGSEGLHDKTNTDNINEIFLNADTVEKYINGDSSDIGSLLGLTIHEATHINKMSELSSKDKEYIKNNDLSDLNALYNLALKKAGKEANEENLAEYVGERVSKSYKGTDESLSSEEILDYLLTLDVKNKEKGRTFKSIEQGTEDAKDVSERENSLVDYVRAKRTKEKIKIVDNNGNQLEEIENISSFESKYMLSLNEAKDILTSTDDIKNGKGIGKLIGGVLQGPHNVFTLVTTALGKPIDSAYSNLGSLSYSLSTNKETNELELNIDKYNSAENIKSELGDLGTVTMMNGIVIPFESKNLLNTAKYSGSKSLYKAATLAKKITKKSDLKVVGGTGRVGKKFNTKIIGEVLDVDVSTGEVIISNSRNKGILAKTNNGSNIGELSTVTNTGGVVSSTLANSNYIGNNLKLLGYNKKSTNLLEYNGKSANEIVSGKEALESSGAKLVSRDDEVIKEFAKTQDLDLDTKDVVRAVTTEGKEVYVVGTADEIADYIEKNPTGKVEVFRGTDNGKEIDIYNETNNIMSDAAKQKWMEDEWSIEGPSLENSRKASEESLDKILTVTDKKTYIESHSSLGTELKKELKTKYGLESIHRPMVSVSLQEEVSKKYFKPETGKLMSGYVENKFLLPQTLEGSSEREFLIEHIAEVK